MKKFGIILLTSFVISISLSACEKEKQNKNERESIDQGNDPNFKIVINNNNQLKTFNRKVEVFGIPIYAVKKVEDTKLLHAANVMAQYLDNDEDGEIDNPNLLKKMIENKAFVVMWKSESDLEIEMPEGGFGQDLGNDETNPNFVSSGLKGRFDASLEEIWHIITHAGYSQLYPEAFGEQAGSILTNAMDIARGGKFTSIPNQYPSKAWYSYDDNTCNYDCQATEYFYWAFTSILGAQQKRLEEIGHEWKLNTENKVKSTDIKIYQLLTNKKYNLPKILPTGKYRR